MPLPNKVSEGCHIDDDNSESSTPSVRENLYSYLFLIEHHSLEFDISISSDVSENRFGPSTYPSSVLRHTHCTLPATTKTWSTSDPLS